MTGTDDTPFDLFVIGGGINGVGVARDAAGRGLRVALAERFDLASGTSSASTKLIHGGLRYLEHYEFRLVRESLVEREILWGIAPHIIRPLRFVLPHHPGTRPSWMIRLGLFLYDHIGGRRRLPPTRTIDLRQDVAGRALCPENHRAFEYSDCRVDDARLVILNARDAADRGAMIWTRHDVTSLRREAGVWQIGLTRPDGTTQHCTARAIVNAAGPGVEGITVLAGVSHRVSARLVRGSHIIVPRKAAHDRAYLFQNPDGRILFAIPYEEDFTLIGTTDVDHGGDAATICASTDEIAYLCAAASRYFREPVHPDDIVWSFAGVRPLVDDGSGKPEAATRGYRLELAGDKGAPPMLSIFGGKITTYRHLAAEALTMLQPVLGGGDHGDWTRLAPLPGGNFSLDTIADTHAALAAAHPFVPAAVMARLFRSYGTRMTRWLDGATHWADLGRDFGQGLTAAEVTYLVADEWAETADDILWRRSKLGLHFTSDETAALDAYLTDNLLVRQSPADR